MKRKKWVLILIIAFPSFFWLILESSTINSRRLPFYGPKTAQAKSDTIYYTVSDRFHPITGSGGAKVDTSVYGVISDPIYAIIFVDKKYRGDSYRLTGLWEYLSYKNQKIEHIPVVLVTQSEDGDSQAYNELIRLGNNRNIHFYALSANSFDTTVKAYFRDKPYYIDYSFFMLIDQNRHIRGYYDGRYVSELKRLIEEYQHLRLKEEKTKLTNSNEIKSNF